MTLLPRRAHPARSWTWFVAFQAAALVPVLLVGLTLTRQYAHQRTSETLRDARTQATDIADLAVGPGLPAGDLAQAAVQDVESRVLTVLSRSDVRDQVLRLKVWDRTGRVVASDAAQLVGASFPLDEDVRDALAGQPHSEVTHLAAGENVQERQFGVAVETYVPLHGADRDVVVGVLEVYLPYEPLAADLREGERTLVTHLAVGLLAILVVTGLLTTAVTTRLRRRTLRAAHLADHDALTGLLSRPAFEARLAALAGSGAPAAVVLADLDDFQRVNDALGHAAGDTLLRHAAQVLQAAAPGGAVARLGGDEFAVLLPGLASVWDAESELTRLHQALGAEVEVDGVPVAATASLGAVLHPEQGATPAALLQHAEAAMAVAKRRTAGTALWAPTGRPVDAAELQLLADLRHAVTDGQLELHYQPQARAADGRVTAVEALVRWQHPVRGRLTPDAFLPLAERTGLVVQLTRWVLDEAAAQLARWQAEGLDLHCSVNISARDLGDPGLPEVARQAAQRHGVAPGRLCLELTETAIIEDPVRAREVLAELAASGFGLSLDDFGQGYTSLGQLRDLPVDELKLDQAFVAGMAEHAADRAIVRTVVELAHSLGLRVVAEGVETAEQAAALAALGYDVLQGWHVGRPRPAPLLAVPAPLGELAQP